MALATALVAGVFGSATAYEADRGLVRVPLRQHVADQPLALSTPVSETLRKHASGKVSLRNYMDAQVRAASLHSCA